MNRRQFLHTAGAATAAVLAGWATGCTPATPVGPAQQGPLRVPFAEPPVRRSREGVLETNLAVKEAQVPLAGRTVTTTVYEGSFPGPTLRCRPGDTLKIRWVNGNTQTSNFHTHGLHVSPSGNSDNVMLMHAPGTSFDYEIHIPADHTPGLNWYHPHPHGMTNDQVFMGQAGALIIEGGLDDLPGLKGLTERLLIVQEVQIDAQGRIPQQRLDDQLPYLRLVNGQLNPTISIRPGEVQRFRLLNACGRSTLELQLDGQSLLQIAADGNPFNAVATRHSIVVPPGGRADFLVKGGQAGETPALRTLAYDAGFNKTPALTLATLAVEGEPVAAISLPTSLIPHDDLRKAKVDRQRELRFQIVRDTPTSAPSFRIDGHVYDHSRMDQTVQLGAIEEWKLINESTDEHPFHIHLNDMQVVEINGEPIDAPGWQDTVIIPRAKPDGTPGTLTFRSAFLDFTGKYVYHCHILPHEDAGMMGNVEVVDGAAASPTPHTGH